MSTHRQRSRQRARIAQVGAVLFAAGGVGAMLLPVPEPETMEPAKPLEISSTVDPLAEARNPIAAEEFQVALDVMNTNVDQKERASQAKPPNVETPLATNTTAEKQPDATPDAGEWKFVGTMFTPRSSIAIINDEVGKQHFLFAGDTLNGTTVVSVSPEHVMLRRGDAEAEHKLSLEARPANLLPDMVNVTSSVGNSSSAEFMTPPVGFDAWPPEEQGKWREERMRLMRQQSENNTRKPTTGTPARPSPRPNTPAKPLGKDMKLQ